MIKNDIELQKCLNKKAKELEYIIKTRYIFEDKLNPHDVVDLCDGDEVSRLHINTMFLETLRRINDLILILPIVDSFLDNEITDTETLKQYNEFLTN